MLTLALYDANTLCRAALREGLEGTGAAMVLHEGDQGNQVIAACRQQRPDVLWLDVLLGDTLSGIEVGMQLRQCYPELPIIFYTACENVADPHLLPVTSLLTHYAVLSKAIYRLPEQFLSIIQEVQTGRTILDPAIARCLHAANQRNQHSPLHRLSLIEREVAERLALGMTNDDIARDIGLTDGRAVSRVNGSIYAAWGLPAIGAGEKVARTRAALIYLTDTLLSWGTSGKPVTVEPDGQVYPWSLPEDVRRRLRPR